MEGSPEDQSASGRCAYCRRDKKLVLSHAIPKAAFRPLLAAGSGSAIGIPDREGVVHRTTDTGEFPMLCAECECEFNRRFDGPLSNALKRLEKAVLSGSTAPILAFSANQLAHAIVAVAWRISRSPANMYLKVNLAAGHLSELEAVLRLPTDQVLRSCTVRVARLTDPLERTGGGFDQSVMGQLIKTPEAFTIKSKKGLPCGFAMDWTMFGFLIHLIVPRLPFNTNRKFGGLKRGAMKVRAAPVNVLDYAPLRDALVAGVAAHEEGRMTASIKDRALRKRRSS